MRIEPATSDDVDDLVEAWVALAETQRRHHSHLLSASNRAAIRPILAYHVVEGTVLVARVDDLARSGESGGGNPGHDDAESGDGAVVGFVNFGLEDAGLAADAVRGLVHNVYVEPDRRGEGVGTALIDAAEAALVDMGADVVAIEALADNEAARRLYRRLGYHPHRVQFERTTETDTSPSDKRDS